MAKFENRARTIDYNQNKDTLDVPDLAVTGAFVGILTGSVTWDPATSIADGDEEAKDVTVTGAALGDFCLVSHDADVLDLTLTASVTAANTVTCILANNTGGAIDVATGTTRVIVFDRA